MTELDMIKCGNRGILFIQVLKVDLTQFKQMAKLLKELAEQLQEDVDVEKLSSHRQEMHEWMNEKVILFIESRISNIEASMVQLDDGTESILVDSIREIINEIEEIVKIRSAKEVAS